MDSLSLDRCIKNFFEDYSLPSFNPFISSTPPAMYPCSFYEPIFNFPPAYNIVDNTLSFDSNSYFMNFGSQYSAPMEPSWMFTLPSLFGFPLFSLPALIFPKFNSSKATQTVPAKTEITVKKKDNKYTYNKYNNYNTSVKYTSLKEAGYNKTLAKRLAQEIANHVESYSTGYCAKYVSNAMARLGIVGKRGDAWELRDSLRNNPHFKEIDPKSVDVKNLPAGCVLVYQRGDAGYSSEYGHVEVTLGNGTTGSDFINNNIVYSPNMSIFVPVMA